MFYTASRIGEILSLTWSAVDLRRGAFTIKQHKTKRKVSALKVLHLRTASRPLAIATCWCWRCADLPEG